MPANVLLRTLTCLMFLTFAMTSDAVGSVIPQLIKDFQLNMKAAGAFHYAPMTAIAVGALLLGFLADRLGRKRTIMLGLALYGTSCLLFATSDSFPAFLTLLVLAGFGISIFKIGALALIGDISASTTEHTSTMNLVEGFFGIGSILGPAIVAILLGAGVSWKWLYVIAAAVCSVLILLAWTASYPASHPLRQEAASLARTLEVARSPYTLFFSVLVMLYVAVEVAVYVWMPTYLDTYRGVGKASAPYTLTAFFVLRAVGRLLGAWTLRRFSWSAVLATFGLAIFACFAGTLIEGGGSGAVLLPLSGLFMSVMYPTLNSKGISCFDRAEHGCVAGVILFFTAIAAAAGPLAMAIVSDAYGNARYGFILAAGFALVLFLGLLINWLTNPAERRLQELDRADYSQQA